MKCSRIATAPVLVGLASSLLLAACTRKEPAQAAAPAATSSAQPAPAAASGYPTRVFFGDTHLHTALSLDAGASGTQLMPADAYRFAKGEQVTSASGQKAKLSRPLDFLVVSDHSDQMGLITDLKAGKPELLTNPVAKHWYELMQSGKASEALVSIVTTFAQGKFPKEIMYNPARPATKPRGWRSSRPRKQPTSPASSPPSSVMSGRRW